MAQLDPRLVRVMARHFTDLQGLRASVIGLFLEAGDQVWHVTHRESWTLLAVPALFGLSWFPLTLLDRHYRSFGKVHTGARDKWRMAVGPVFAFLLNMPSRGFPSVAFLFVSAFPTWLAWDCRPFRWHQLLVSAALIYVAFGRAPFPDAGGYAWIAPRFWTVPAALVITGLLDHLLFVQTMRAARALAAEAS